MRNMIRALSVFSLLMLFSSVAAQQATPTPEAPVVDASVDGWVIIGDVDGVNDGTELCVTGQTDASIWYYDAPEDFVEAIPTAYGQTLTFELKQEIGATPSGVTVEFVVGNALILGYALPDDSGADYIRYNIPLTTTAGWEELDGLFDISDVELFQQLLSDVTRVQIYGQGAADSCLRGAAVTSSPLAGDTVPYYLVSQVDDISGNGIPVGCDGFMIPLETEAAFSDDPAENVSATIEALLSPPPLDADFSELTNYFENQDIVLTSVTVDDSGHATVSFEGQFLLLGTCADPQIEAQLLLGIFSDPRIISARVNVNGENIKPFFDMSGETGPDEDFTRDDIGIRWW